MEGKGVRMIIQHETCFSVGIIMGQLHVNVISLSRLHDFWVNDARTRHTTNVDDTLRECGYSYAVRYHPLIIILGISRHTCSKHESAPQSRQRLGLHQLESL